MKTCWACPPAPPYLKAFPATHIVPIILSASPAHKCPGEKKKSPQESLLLAGVSLVAQQVKNLTSIHKDEGSIPGLA